MIEWFTILTNGEDKMGMVLCQKVQRKKERERERGNERDQRERSKRENIQNVKKYFFSLDVKSRSEAFIYYLRTLWLAANQNEFLSS